MGRWGLATPQEVRQPLSAPIAQQSNHNAPCVHVRRQGLKRLQRACRCWPSVPDVPTQATTPPLPQASWCSSECRAHCRVLVGA